MKSPIDTLKAPVVQSLEFIRRVEAYGARIAIESLLAPENFRQYELNLDSQKHSTSRDSIDPR